MFLATVRVNEEYDVATSALPRLLMNQRVIGLPHHYLYWNSYSNINSVLRLLKAYKGDFKGIFPYSIPLSPTLGERELSFLT